MNTVTEREMLTDEEASEKGSLSVETQKAQDALQVYFLKPLKISPGVYKYPINPKPWIIWEFWVRHREPTIVTFRATGTEDFSTEYSLEEREPEKPSFEKVPIFKRPFPLAKVSCQQCFLEVFSNNPLPVYIKYSVNHPEDDLYPNYHLFTMDHYQGSVIRFVNGSLNYHTRLDNMKIEESHEESKSSSYAEAMEDLSQKILRVCSENANLNFDVSPESAPNYLRALSDLGFHTYTIYGQGNNTSFIFNV